MTVRPRNGQARFGLVRLALVSVIGLAGCAVAVLGGIEWQQTLEQSAMSVPCVRLDTADIWMTVGFFMPALGAYTVFISRLGPQAQSIATAALLVGASLSVVMPRAGIWWTTQAFEQAGYREVDMLRHAGRHSYSTTYALGATTCADPAPTAK